jgi:hypothetical protein
MQKQVEPDGSIDKLEPRHKVTDPNLVKRLEESMRKDGWIGRPLVVAKVMLQPRPHALYNRTRRPTIQSNVVT